MAGRRGGPGADMPTFLDRRLDVAACPPGFADWTDGRYAPGRSSLAGAGAGLYWPAAAGRTLTVQERVPWKGVA